jgi:mRNA-degrading endonuclease RelE of RelBE toxin-antitoxin system
MRYDIIFAPEAVHDLKRLRANIRAVVKDAIVKHLRHEPTKLSRSRIKRLKGLAQPQYRLRIDEVRVFYDVNEDRVEILAIVAKADASSWLAKVGKRS